MTRAFSPCSRGSVLSGRPRCGRVSASSSRTRPSWRPTETPGRSAARRLSTPQRAKRRDLTTDRVLRKADPPGDRPVAGSHHDRVGASTTVGKQVEEHEHAVAAHPAHERLAGWAESDHPAGDGAVSHGHRPPSAGRPRRSGEWRPSAAEQPPDCATSITSTSACSSRAASRRRSEASPASTSGRRPAPPPGDASVGSSRGGSERGMPYVCSIPASSASARSRLTDRPASPVAGGRG